MVLEVTIRGGKMLATGGVRANEVFVTCISPSAKAKKPMRCPSRSRGTPLGLRYSHEGHTRKAQRASSRNRNRAEAFLVDPPTDDYWRVQSFDPALAPDPLRTALAVPAVSASRTGHA
jgi:hypothetical protein